MERRETEIPQQEDFVNLFHQRLQNWPVLNGRKRIDNARPFSSLGCAEANRLLPVVLFAKKGAIKDEAQVDCEWNLWASHSVETLNTQAPHYTLEFQVPNHFNLTFRPGYVLETADDLLHLLVEKDHLAHERRGIKREEDIKSWHNLQDRYGIHTIHGQSIGSEEMSTGEYKFYEELMPFLDDEFIGKIRLNNMFEEYRQKFNMTDAEFALFQTRSETAFYTKIPLNHHELAIKVTGRDPR